MSPSGRLGATPATDGGRRRARNRLGRGEALPAARSNPEATRWTKQNKKGLLQRTSPMPSSPLSLENRKAGEPLHLRAPGRGGEWGVRQTRRRAKVAGEGPVPSAGWKDGRDLQPRLRGRTSDASCLWSHMVQRRASMMQRRDPRRDSVRSPACQVKVSQYFCSVNSGKTASAPYLLISRELEGRHPLSALNSPDTDPQTHSIVSSLSSESCDPPVPPLPHMGGPSVQGGPRCGGDLQCGLAELGPHPTLPSPTAPPFARQLLPCQHEPGLWLSLMEERISHGLESGSSSCWKTQGTRVMATH